MRQQGLTCRAKDLTVESLAGGEPVRHDRRYSLCVVVPRSGDKDKVPDLLYGSRGVLYRAGAAGGRSSSRYSL